MDEAQKRVDNVGNRVRASVTQATETAHTAAYLSFWTFMSLCSAPSAQRSAPSAQRSAAIWPTISPLGVRYPWRRGNRDGGGTDRVATRWRNERAHTAARFPQSAKYTA